MCKQGLFFLCISGFKKISKQAKFYKPKYVCICNEVHRNTLMENLDSKEYKILTGRNGLLELSQNTDADIIINADSLKDGYYTVSNSMEYYAKGDTLLAKFFSEALDMAQSDIEDYFNGKLFSPEEVVFIVFHAGLSQDFAYPSLDPTIYDLKSAYID